MRRIVASRLALKFATACVLSLVFTGCGQRGPLYLPEEARDIVTRPAPPSSPSAPSSPETVDAPDTPPSPAPEVSEPEETPPDGKDDDDNGEPRR